MIYAFLVFSEECSADTHLQDRKLSRIKVLC